MLDLHVVAHHTLLGVSPSVWMSHNVKPPPPVFFLFGCRGALLGEMLVLFIF